MKNSLPKFFFASISITLLGLIMSFIVACGGNGNDETDDKKITKVNVALDWFPWSNHSGLFVAKERGYFAEEGLDVNIYTPANPATVLQTVAAGSDDFGISYQMEVLLARASDIPVISIAALVQHPLNSIMALKESRIERPRDLAGKTIGYPDLPSDKAMLAAILEADGSSIDEVNLVNVGFDLVPALVGKKVDAILGAYWVHESIAAENLGYPVSIMRLEQWGVPDFYELVLVTSEKKIDENPDLVKSFLKASAKGYKDAIENPQGAIDVLFKMHPETDPEIERPGIELLVPLWIGDAPKFGWQEEAIWIDFGNWMSANGVASETLESAKAFTNEFLPR